MDPAPLVVDRLLGFSTRLHEWSGRMNLTGHETLREIVARLVLDAASIAALLDEIRPHASCLVDLGSGAGLPGLPIAILRPSCRVTLVESRTRRHHFQRAVVRELSLGNARPLLGRAEQIEPAPQDVVVAQAMAQPDRVLGWMARWAAPGGTLLLPCTPAQAERRLAAPVGVELADARRYRVPGGGAERALLVGRRLE